MKRPLLIILGIIIVLILLGIWVYVLLTGTTNNGDQFNDFGFGDTTDQTFQELPDQDNSPTVDVTSFDQLRQLTTKPVAGFTEVQVSASSTPYVQYVEAGTGHVYTIDLETGTETRVSATTIPLTSRAVITPNGAHLLFQAGTGQTTEFIVGTLATSSDELSNFALSEILVSFATNNDNEIMYATPDGNNTLAKAYNPRTNASRVLFVIPFRDVAVDWGSDAAGPHYVYPKAASRLEGFVYAYTNGAMSRLPISGYGLSAVGSESATIHSTVLSSGEYVTNSYTNDTNVSIPIPIIPEKCAFSPLQTNTAICGASFGVFSDFMPDVWYRGEITPADSLWEVQTEFGATTLLENIFDERQQTLDVITPQFSADGSNFYFQNKIDQTLWMYEYVLTDSGTI